MVGLGETDEEILEVMRDLRAHGVTMLTKLKEDPELKSIPVIMLTAESGRENVLHIAKLGVRDYLVKPFKENQLIEKVERIVPLQKKAAA